MQQTIRKIIAMSMSIVMLFATLYFVPIEEAKGAVDTTYTYDGTNQQPYAGQKYVIIKADIPDNENSLFGSKGGPEQVTVQSGTIIGDNAFKGCTNLKTVYLSSSVAVIGKSAFEETGI
ncbi:MAG: leucine-rich repeat protein, partial [Lachnospiraceae bacterium]|nr:leucine-rich repeat protein [Lachnospiraceae bacterium]